MPDYQKGKIYKIVDPNEEMIYVGSTVNKLANRMAQHREKFRSASHYYSLHDIFNKYGVENCKIVLIENFSCNSKEELHKKEAEYIKLLQCVNKNIPARIGKEYYQDNKDKIKKYVKEYNEINKEKIKVARKDYHKQYREANRDKIKSHRDLNKVKTKEYMKEYYLKKKLSNIQDAPDSESISE